MTPPRLGPIYRLDVLSFNPNAESRLVSRLYNSTIVTHPTSLPIRRRLKYVTMGVRRFAPNDAHDPVFTTNGYVHRHYLWDTCNKYKVWHESTAFQQCCDEGELTALAQRLEGESVIMDYPVDDAAVVIEVGTLRGRHIVYAARNEMSRETAVGLLHLLWHLGDGVSIESVRVKDLESPRGTRIVLNPLLSELLAQFARTPESFMLRAGLLRADCPSPTSIPVCLKVGELCLDISERSEVMKTVELAIRAAPNIRRLHAELSWQLELQLRPDEVIDLFIEAFTSTLPSIGRSIVPKLIVVPCKCGDQWPSRCPPMEEMKREVLPYYPYMRYRHRFINTNSGETFELTLTWNLKPNGEEEKTLLDVEFDFRA